MNKQSLIIGSRTVDNEEIKIDEYTLTLIRFHGEVHGSACCLETLFSVYIPLLVLVYALMSDAQRSVAG